MFGKTARPLNPKANGAEEKFCGFIETANWYSAQTPFANFDKNGAISYRQVDKSPKIAKIWAASPNSKDSRMEKIVKDKSKPAPGDYGHEKAFRKTQCPKSDFILGKSDRKNFTEDISKRKSYVPSPGQYFKSDIA